MKLVRFGAPGREKPGIIDGDGRIRDLSKIVPDIAGETLSPKGLNKIKKTDISKLPAVKAGTRLGPWLGTKHEIANVQKRDMWLDFNGEKRQRGNTNTMIFGIAHTVWYCSQFFVMEPGDVITTGTPPGVALGMKPEPVWLKAGDTVTLGIQGLGEQRQKIVKFKA